MAIAASDSNLASCPLLTGMSTEERQQVLDLMEHETYPAGETILHEGKTVQFLWIIARGHCRVVKSMKSGGDHELAVLEPGAVFGEMSFFHPGPHSASIKTLTEVEVLRLSRRQFDELEQTNTKAAYKIVLNTAAVLVERLRQMDEWVCGLIERPGANGYREEWKEFRAKLYSDWPF